MQVTVFDLQYEQNGEATGASIGTVWDREKADSIAARCGDLTVVPIEMSEDQALAVCE